MKSHELARLLLTLPDMPVATHAHGHTYNSEGDARSHGKLKVGLLAHYANDAIIIGDIGRRNLNAPNWYVLELYHGEAPNSYSYTDVYGNYVWTKSYPGKTVSHPGDESVGPRCKP